MIGLLLRRWRCHCDPPRYAEDDMWLCGCGIWWRLWAGSWLPVTARTAEKLFVQRMHLAFRRGMIPRPLDTTKPLAGHDSQGLRQLQGMPARQAAANATAHTRRRSARECGPAR